MKLSLKIREDQQNHHYHKIPLLRAKIPITVFGLPFLSGIVAGDSSELSFNLRTNFSSGPSLKLSYNPTTPTPTTTTPLTLSLKSGVSLFGSPHNSPLIISAHFTPFSNSNPTFSLHFKPQLGDFTLQKTTFSPPNPNPNPKSNGGVEFEPLERPLVWRDLTIESCSSAKYGILSGIAVRARTALPVTKRVTVNFRWGVNFPADFGTKLPFLMVDKVGIERVEEVKSIESNVGDLELLKGMCYWMRTDLEILQRDNREMKQSLEEMRLGVSARTDSVRKNSLPSVENSSEFERWRSKKSGGEESGRRELQKPMSRASDVENELQRAIKAASS